MSPEQPEMQFPGTPPRADDVEGHQLNKWDTADGEDQLGPDSPPSVEEIEEQGYLKIDD